MPRLRERLADDEAIVRVALRQHDIGERGDLPRVGQMLGCAVGEGHGEIFFVDRKEQFHDPHGLIARRSTRCRRWSVERDRLEAQPRSRQLAIIRRCTFGGLS